MINIETLEEYWELYEIKTDMNRVKKILELLSFFEDFHKKHISSLNIKNSLYLSPHFIIRMSQSDITYRTIINTLKIITKIHVEGINNVEVSFGTNNGFNVLKMPDNRIEINNFEIFIVFKIRKEEFYLNRLDLISIGIPGERRRNSRKPNGWDDMTHKEKMTFLDMR